LWLRRAAVEKVGPFDECYGKYFEDVDMCLRMGRAGWSVAYHGAASCYHLEARASKKLLSADACRHLRAYLRWLRRRSLYPAHNIRGPAGVRRGDAPLPAAACPAAEPHGGIPRADDGSSALPLPNLAEVLPLQVPSPPPPAYQQA
jgi:hypothetical protein